MKGRVKLTPFPEIDDNLMIICRKFSEQIFFRMALDKRFDSCFNGRLILETSNGNSGWNDSIFTCLSPLHICIWILRTATYQSAAERSRSNQASKIKLLRE